MNITRESKASFNDIIQIELTKEDYLPGFEQKLKKYSKEMSINGFRKGAVPVGMIKKMYGESVLAEEINHLADHALNDFVKENSIKLLGRPILADEQDTIDIKPNEDKSYLLKFEIAYEPQYEISLTGNTYSRYEIEVTESMVAKEVENVFGYFTKLEDSADPIADGDTFYFNIKNASGFSSESFASTADLTEVGLKELIGKKTNDLLDVKLVEAFNNEKLNIKKYVLNLKDDADMSDEDYNGIFNLEFTNVKKKQVPSELTAEQIANVTRDESKSTLEELKIALEDDIKKQYNNLSLNYLRNDVYEYIVANTKMELPVDFLKRWIVSEKENNLTKESVEKDFDNIAKSIKWDLITSKFALENQIKVEMEEVKNDYRARYMQYFLQSGYTPPAEQMEKFIADAMKDQNAVRKTFESILDTKVLDKMIEGISTKSVKFTEEDFIAESKRRAEKNAKQHNHGEEGHVHDENCNH